MKGRCLILVASLCATSHAAFADVTIEMKHNGVRQLIRLSPYALESDMENGALIFRGDKRLLWTVDTKGKSYTEMTEEDAKAAGAKMDSAMVVLKEKLRQAPPAARAKMERLMKQRNCALHGRTIEPMGLSKKVNGFECAGYTVSANDGETTEIWTADPRALKLGAEELAVLREFAAFMKTIVPGTNQFREMIKDYERPAGDQVPGFPILTISKDESGTERWRSEVVKIDGASVPVDRFEIPAGFTKGSSTTDE